jgi:hypothetical protein
MGQPNYGPSMRLMIHLSQRGSIRAFEVEEIPFTKD